MSDVWAKLEGHAINGAYPLLRYLGATNHSVVFLTESAKLARHELALKLVPAVPALAQLQLARWRASAALVHPRLIQIFDAGQCQIGARHFLYVVTDYADQNLAQLLERRALTEEETREMLEPVLDALAFLHERKLVQGRLKPSNVLVVGDRIRLASDTIRPFSETGRTSRVTSAYTPPEAGEGTRTAASDVWALGITLCEALTRQEPSGLHEGEMSLPPELSPVFRGVVARSVNRRARSRPTVNELQVWSRGAQLVASLSASGAHRAPAAEAISDSGDASPIRSGGVARTSAERRWMGLVLAVILGALALFVLGWAAIRSSDSHAAATSSSSGGSGSARDTLDAGGAQNRASPGLILRAQTFTRSTR
ncbi:MAG: protein kinase [Gammaproteobacteria bacterium]